MVSIEYKDGKHCYMDNRLYKNLVKIKKALKDDDDYVLLLDGAERSGKSTLGQQIARLIYPDFTHVYMCISIEELSNAIDTAEKGSAVVFDEANRGFGSENWNNKINKLLKTKFMEMGQKNLFIIIIAPNFFMLSSYIVLHRSRSFIHVYRKKGKRGFFAAFDSRKKRLLYLKGKKTLSYSGKGFPRANYCGRFMNQYVIDEVAYRKKKLESYNDFDIVKELKGKFYERNQLIKDLEKQGLSWIEIEEKLGTMGIKLSYESIRRICLEGKNS